MIKHLKLSGFTTFGENTFEFSKGINVFIGLNGTGKTHLLKVMAASVQAHNQLIKSPSQAKERFESMVAEQLIRYFKPMQLGRLVKRQPGRAAAQVQLEIEGRSTLQFSFATNSKSSVKAEHVASGEEISSLYLPPREMFSLYEGFLGLVKNREVSFDATYIELAEALGAPALKGARADKTRELVAPLEDALGIKVVKEQERFYIKDKNGKMEAHLVAEGIRKLASVMHLILNGELDKNSILFWDEPEANLNPSLIKVVVNFVMALAERGVQVFVSTHDYLFTHLLSLNAEYKTLTSAPQMKFFSLVKTGEGANEGDIDVETGPTLVEIQQNPILDEYEAYFNLQQEYFSKSMTGETN